MYIISKLGKWDKTDNLKLYGDFGIDELLEAEQESYLLFLYNEYLEKAIKETKRVLKTKGIFVASGIHYRKDSKS